MLKAETYVTWQIRRFALRTTAISAKIVSTVGAMPVTVVVVGCGVWVWGFGYVGQRTVEAGAVFEGIREAQKESSSA